MPVTNERIPFVLGPASGDVPGERVVTLPQVPIGYVAAEPAVIAWPRITSPVTVEPLASPAEDVVVADAFAFANTVWTVTSPPKSEIVETCAEALELEGVPGAANAPEVTVAAEITEPSAGSENEPAPTASGGAETGAAEAAGWPGTATWTANARAELVPFALSDAPADPTEPTRSASPSVTGSSRTTTA